MPVSPPSALRLVVDNLAVSRGERRLFAGLSFDLKAGGALAIMGPNGVGKSSLLRAIAGFLPPDTGTVRLDGADDPAQPGLAAHYVGHADALKGTLTAAENLTFWARYLGPGRGLEPRAALAEAGLAALADLPVAVLSAGQKRRVSLARLRVAWRPLWLLDEPVTALDAAAQDFFDATLASHRAAGGIALAATHAPLGGLAELRLG